MKTGANVVEFNFWTDPKRTAKILGAKKRLDPYADHQTLKVFPFGELFFDYEEGVKILAPVDKLEAAAKFVREFFLSLGATTKQMRKLCSVDYMTWSADGNGRYWGDPNDKNRKREITVMKSNGFRENDARWFLK